MELINTMDLLERLVLNKAPKHHPSDNPPDGWEALKAWAATNTLGFDSLPVWSGKSDRTIWSSPRVNYAFRAWHDATHLAMGRDFSKAGELAVSRTQCAYVRRELGLWGPKAARVLWAETAGQVLYFERHGHFPEDQRAFVMSCLRGEGVVA